MSSNETATNNAQVQEAILSVLTSLTSVNSIRPNKLRKLICNQVKGTNWTQYQVVLEQMISTNQIQTKQLDNGERVLLALSSSSSSSKDSTTTTGATPSQSQEQQEDNNDQTKHQTKTTSLQIPQAIAHHLTRKGHAKQRNIEKNTKTKMQIIKNDEESKKGSSSLLLLVIEAEYPTKEREHVDENVEEIVQKHMNAATLLIKNMIKSYKKNPDHFEKKAGGTFAEQEEAKKRKEEILKKRHKKKIAANVGDMVTNNEKGKKKKQRKFY